MPSSEDLTEARDLIRSARTVVILTGAGVSADSGVPTFRSAAGLWKRYRPEELATPEAFSRDPGTVLEWYGWRRRLVRECSPNEGHRAIAKLLLSRDGVTLITQNVDGLHGRALRQLQSAKFGRRSHGSAPVPGVTLELHGNLLRSRCSECGESADDSPGSSDSGSQASLPRCPSCDALMRPAVVWFGEALDEGVLSRAIDAACGADVCISAGTSAMVQPAAQLPLLTRESGGSVIEVNPEVTPITGFADIHLRGTSSAILPELIEPPE